MVETLREAAQRSLGQGAADAAAGYLGRALREALDGPARAEVLVELGLAKRLTDGPAAAEHLAEGYELLTDPERRAAVALELGSALFYLNRIPDAIAVYERALVEIDAHELPDLHERLEAELIASAWWTPETLPLAQERLAALELDALHGGFGSDLLLADVAFYQGRLAADRAAATAAARSALASGELAASGALGFNYVAFALGSVGLFSEAIAAYDAALAAALGRGDIFRIGTLYAFRGRVKMVRGDLEAALADLREGLDLVVAQGVRTAVPYAVSFLAQALVERGEIEEAAAVVGSAGLPDRLPVTGHLFFFQLARARVRIESGDVERGLEDMLDLGERTRLVVFDNPGTYPWRRFAAEAMARGGRREEASALAAENLELARRWGAPYTVGAAAADVRRRRGRRGGRAAPARGGRRPRRLGHACRARAGARRPRRSPPPRQPAQRGTRPAPQRRRAGPAAAARPRSSSARTRSSPRRAHARGR